MKMKIERIKCLAVDVDGTITDEKNNLDLKAVEMIRKLKEKKKLKIILASGNAYPVLMGIARYIGGIDLVIAENGGIIGWENKYIILGERTIGERARKIINENFSEIVKESWQNEYRKIDFAYKIKRGSWMEAYEKIKRLMEKKLPEAKVVFSGVAIHVRDRKVNKGEALKKAAEILKFHLEEIMAIGDSDVDVEMLEVAGIGVAVANASEKALRVADIVTWGMRGRGFTEIAEMILNEIKRLS
ncbi:MAG TPA: phosphoglycolate phosphatase [Candidatus Bathyarchaeota archaeon]|nr:phosphoglycolate phosphatase [Candidatus Bathyarchaeota archaeon]